MHKLQLFLISFGAAGLLLAQQSDPTGVSKPSVAVGTGTHLPSKNAIFRTIQGVVKDQAGNPVSGAIVQMKNLKTSKVVDFATHEDGKFAFHELSMNIDYELTASHDGVKSVLRKVSPYDSRKDITLNFQLEAAAAKKP